MDDSGICPERRRSLFSQRPVYFHSKESERIMSGKTVNQSGTIFQTKKVQSGNQMWFSKKKHTDDKDDDVTIETLPADASNSGRMSSCSSRFPSELSLAEMDRSEGTTDSALHTIQEPLPTPMPRPILKERCKKEPLYIRAGKPLWFPPRKNKNKKDTFCELTRHVSIGTDTTEDTATATATDGDSKSLCFGVVAIRTYNQTLGDNPAVTIGPPIQLDWEYKEHDEIDVNEFECSKSCCYKRNQDQLRLSYYKRKNILTQQYNFEKDDFAKAKKDVNRIKFRREITNILLPVQLLEEALASAGRKTQRLFRRTTKQ